MNPLATVRDEAISSGENRPAPREVALDGQLDSRAGALARASFEQALDAMLLTDDERRYVDANPAACSLLALPHDELVSRRLDDFTAPEDRPLLDNAWSEFLKTGSQSGEFSLIAADGSRRTVELRATANVLPGCHLSVLRDITDRAVAEEAQRTKDAFDFLSRVVEGVDEGLFAVDERRCFSFVNPAAAAMLGYGSPAELLGLPVHETIHYKRPDGSGFPIAECPLLAIFETREPMRGEDWFVRKDGSMLPVSYSVSIIPVPGGQGTVTAFRDVSDRRARALKQKRELETLTWLGRIREALDEGRMAVHAQPIVELASRAVVQHELLIRMTNGNGDAMLPGLFMPTAERYGLAPEIDRWMIERGIALTSELGTVEINLSAASLGDPDLLAAIEAQADAATTDPSRVVLEITETALMENVETASSFVHRLAELGFRFALDDFGTGYGSFMDLKVLPISFLKIDMQFVRAVARDADDRRVVEAIVNLAKAFGQKTIAEGVEDEATAETLRSLGVDYGQGHFFGRPAPAPASASRPHGARPSAGRTERAPERITNPLAG